MSYLVSLLLPFIVCFGLSATTSILWWRTFRSPWLFAVIGFLALLGLHRIVQAAAALVTLRHPGGFFLEARENPGLFQRAMESLTLESAITCLILVIFGLPLLLWLRRFLLAA